MQTDSAPNIFSESSDDDSITAGRPAASGCLPMRTPRSSALPAGSRPSVRFVDDDELDAVSRSTSRRWPSTTMDGDVWHSQGKQGHRLSATTGRLSSRLSALTPQTSMYAHSPATEPQRTPIVASMRVVHSTTVQVYDDTRYVGLCLAALRVPSTTDALHPSPRPILSITESGGSLGRVLYTTLLSPQLSLVLDATRPQYAQLTMGEDATECQDWSERVLFSANASSPRSPSSPTPPTHKTCLLMFQDRSACLAFVAAAHTIAHFHGLHEVDPSAEVPRPRTIRLPEDHPPASASTTAEVQLGSRASFSLYAWLLKAVDGLPFFSIGELIDSAPAEAPRTPFVGLTSAAVGEAMVERQVVGMRVGEGRLIFVPPSYHSAGTVQRSKSGATGGPLLCDIRPEWRRETIVLYVQCVQIPAMASVPYQSSLTETDGTNGSVADVTQHHGAPILADFTPQMQQTWLHAMSAQFAAAGGKHGQSNEQTGILQEQLRMVLLRMDELQREIGNVRHGLDHVDVSACLQKNNTVLQRLIRQAIGTAPKNDADVAEEVHFDRDALLARIEKLNMQFVEAQTNYHHALESVGRYADRVHALEGDLHTQKESLDLVLKNTTETHQLKLVELELTHRRALEQVGRDQYAAGRKDGHREGVVEGRQEAIDAGDGEQVMSWRLAVLHKEQAVVKLEKQLQELDFQRTQEQRVLRGEVQGLRHLVEKYQQRKLAARENNPMTQNSDPLSTTRSHGPPAKEVRRHLKGILNCLYAQVDAELSALTTGTHTPLSKEVVLTALLRSIKEAADTPLPSCVLEPAIAMNAADPQNELDTHGSTTRSVPVPSEAIPRDTESDVYPQTSVLAPDAREDNPHVSARTPLDDDVAARSLTSPPRGVHGSSTHDMDEGAEGTSPSQPRQLLLGSTPIPTAAFGRLPTVEEHARFISDLDMTPLPVPQQPLSLMGSGASSEGSPRDSPAERPPRLTVCYPRRPPT